MAEFLELHTDVVAALAAVNENPVDERLLLRVRRGLLSLGLKGRARR